MLMIIAILLSLTAGYFAIRRIIRVKKWWRWPVSASVFVICSLITFCFCVMVSGRITGHKADLFLQNVIQNFDQDFLSQNLDEREKEEIKDIIEKIKDSKYSVKFYDYFFGLWEYEVQFIDEESFIFTVKEEPFPLFRISINPSFKLRSVRKINEK